MQNLILVAGAGRNVGKTLLSCQLIEKLSVNKSVDAVKISKHQHKLTGRLKKLVEEDGLLITEELDRDSPKDSSRFLRAGAKRSFFVICETSKLPQLAVWINDNCQRLTVCESRALGAIVKPGSAVFVDNEGSDKTNIWSFPFISVKNNAAHFVPDTDYICKVIISKMEDETDG